MGRLRPFQCSEGQSFKASEKCLSFPEPWGRKVPLPGPGGARRLQGKRLKPGKGCPAWARKLGNAGRTGPPPFHTLFYSPPSLSILAVGWPGEACPSPQHLLSAELRTLGPEPPTRGQSSLRCGCAWLGRFQPLLIAAAKLVWRIRTGVCSLSGEL